MKKIFTLLMFFCIAATYSQAPQGFNYQATVRDNNGNLIINQNVYFKFNIMRNSPTSLPTYSETHYVPTDDLGNVSLVIGQGTATEGTFSEIPWGEGAYYLGIELNTGSGYVAMGTTQFLSVPYALYANQAGNGGAAQNLASVLSHGNYGEGIQIKHIGDPTDEQDAVTKSFVHLHVSATGDTLYLGEQWVIVPGISEANQGEEPPTGTVTDIDGNVYTTITIGNRIWMADNLKVTHYRNGESINYPGENNDLWASNTLGAYAWYNNNMEWKNIYGGLYNFYAVVNEWGLCPDGWHVPNLEEWELLANSIGGLDSPNGNELKSCHQVESPIEGCSTSIHPRWDWSEQHGTNNYGFNGTPAGIRGMQGNFEGLGVHNGLWSSAAISDTRAWARSLQSAQGGIIVDDAYSHQGLSVRCVKFIDGK